MLFGSHQNNHVFDDLGGGHIPELPSDWLLTTQPSLDRLSPGPLWERACVRKQWSTETGWCVCTWVLVTVTHQISRVLTGMLVVMWLVT